MKFSNMFANINRMNMKLDTTPADMFDCERRKAICHHICDNSPGRHFIVSSNLKRSQNETSLRSCEATIVTSSTFLLRINSFIVIKIA